MRKEENQDQTKCMRLALHPTKEQKETLMLWLDGARCAYNMGVEYVNREKKTSLKDIREGARVGTGRRRAKKKGEAKRPDAENIWDEKYPRLRTVPPKVRDSALIDLHKACVTLWAKERCFRREMKFKTSKDRSQSMAIERAWLNCKTDRSVWSPLFGTIADRSAMRTEDGKTLPSTFEHDCRLVSERISGGFYLIVPTALKHVRRSETQGPDGIDDTTIVGFGHIVAIDPGVRTFATCYDPGRSLVTEWGMMGGRKDGRHLGTELLGWLTRKVARLERKSKTARNARSRRRIRAVADRVRRRMTNLTDEMHHKLALWLCRNYQVVLLPRFSVRDVSRRRNLRTGKRRLMGRNSVRKLYQMSPFRFRQFLIHKAREHDTTVVICDEQYTTKTCSMCGRMHEQGAAKVFTCPTCGFVCDRDFNASKNILLRYMSIHGIDAMTLENHPMGVAFGGLV
jgi:transposase